MEVEICPWWKGLDTTCVTVPTMVVFYKDDGDGQYKWIIRNDMQELTLTQPLKNIRVVHGKPNFTQCLFNILLYNPNMAMQRVEKWSIDVRSCGTLEFMYCMDRDEKIIVPPLPRELNHNVTFFQQCNPLILGAISLGFYTNIRYTMTRMLLSSTT